MTAPGRTFSLDGKAILVSGAGSGIGRAAAIGLAEAGARVTLVGRRHDLLQETAALIDDDRRTQIFVADVRERDQVLAMTAKAVDRFGQLGRVDKVDSQAG